MPFDIAGAKEAGYSSAEIADYLGAENKFDTEAARKGGYSDEELIAHLSPSEKPEEELPERTWKEAASDVGISAAKGIIGVPQALVGLADIAGTPFGVSPGKYLEEKGYDFEKNQKLLSEQYSPRQKAEIAALSKAEGFTGNILSAIEYPSAVGGMLMESAAPMVAGGIMGKVAKVAAGLETAVAAGAANNSAGTSSPASPVIAIGAPSSASPPSGTRIVRITPSS